MTTQPTKASFLLTSWEGGGNMPPVLAVARRLIRAGHNVRVMSDEADRADVGATGARFVPWTTAPCRTDKSAANDLVRDWAAPTPLDGLKCVIDNVMCGPAHLYARDTLEEIRKEPSDVLVNSDLLMGPMLAAEVSGTPAVFLCANVPLFPVDGIPPLGPGLTPARNDAERALHAEVTLGNIALFDHGLPALNAARRALGLAPLTHVVDQAAIARKTLIATARAFDFAPEALPPDIVYVGPQLEDPSVDEQWTAPWPADDTRPLVLVSFSTTFQNQGAALQRVLDAARDLPARIFATVGPALAETSFDIGENTRLAVRAPHAAVMKEARAVVCHGGHGTVIRGLANDCTLLVLPMGRDQNDNATRVAARGAGLALSPDSAVPDIRQALGRLLSDPGFAGKAAELGAAIRAEAAASPVLEVLEALARSPGVDRAA